MSGGRAASAVCLPGMQMAVKRDTLKPWIKFLIRITRKSLYKKPISDVTSRSWRSKRRAGIGALTKKATSVRFLREGRGKVLKTLNPDERIQGNPRKTKKWADPISP